MSEPPQKPGRSRQDYATPPSFLRAIEQRFGPIDLDLACRIDNMVAPHGLTEDLDALAQDWRAPEVRSLVNDSVAPLVSVRVAFCNPPFGNIRPWAAKCESVRDLPRWTLMLVPASIDSHWYRDCLLGRTMVWGIPRLQFVGTDSSYPKALMLVGAGFGVSGHGFWDWRETGSRRESAAGPRLVPKGTCLDSAQHLSP